MEFKSIESKRIYEEREAQRLEDKRVANIHVIGNGFILRTRSGKWFYPTLEFLFHALGDYLTLIQKEMEEKKV